MFKKGLIIYSSILLALTMNTMAVFSLSQKQKETIDSGIYYFDVDPDSSGGGILPLDESELIKTVAFSGGPITPTGIVLHWTGGNPNATVDEFISSIQSNTSCPGGCSVQLYIDGSGNVHQLVNDLATKTAHAAGYNDCCIGIEIGGGSDGTVATSEKELNENAAQKLAVARTVAYLRQKYNIQINTDVDGKKGILSHHLVSDSKSDVGDTYLAEIIRMQSSGSGSGSFNPGDPNSLPANVRPVDFGLSPNVAIGQELAAPFGWNQGNQFQCLFELYSRESSWNELAENPTSKAYGIPQSLPANKMATEGADYRTNPRTQINWGLKYIKDRYDSPCAAIEFHNIKNWY